MFGRGFYRDSLRHFKVLTVGVGISRDPKQFLGVGYADLLEETDCLFQNNNFSQTLRLHE